MTLLWWTTITGWWLLLTPLKHMTSSVGMMTFPIYWKIKHVPNHQPDNKSGAWSPGLVIEGSVKFLDDWIRFGRWQWPSVSDRSLVQVSCWLCKLPCCLHRYHCYLHFLVHCLFPATCEGWSGRSGSTFGGFRKKKTCRWCHSKTSQSASHSDQWISCDIYFDPGQKYCGWKKSCTSW